jgi:tetratricopeptide (TPR) repeat protein
MESGLVHHHGRIEPFWLRIPSFFAYPSQKSVLMVMIGFSVLQVFTYLPAIDWIVALLLWLAAYKYSYEVLVHTAEGHLDPPESRYMAGTDSMGLRQFFLVIGMILMVQGVWWFTESMIISGIFALCMLLAFPAAIITLGMTRSLFAALNPVTWISLIARIGGPYFLVFLFLFMMVSSVGALEAFLEPDSLLLYTLMRPLFYFIDFYFMVAMFHLMGYMIYQYHEELGVDVTSSERPSERAAAPDVPLIAQAKDLVQEGKLSEAVDLVGGQLRSQGGTPELHDHYRKLLRLKKDKRALLEHAGQYIPILLESAEKPQKAVDVVAECYKMDPRFTLTYPAYVTTLAEHANNRGMHKVALQLTSGFAKRFPNHPDIPVNYFLAAKILTDRMGEDEKALSILRSLKKKFPEHPLQPEIQRYTQTLENIRSA